MSEDVRVNDLKASRLNTGQQSVGTSATQIVAANSNRLNIIIFNSGASTVFIGSSNAVTTLTGHALPAGQALNSRNWNGAYYGIVTTGAVTVTFYEEVE